MPKLQVPLITILSLLMMGVPARGRANSGQIPGGGYGVLVTGTISSRQGNPLSMVRLDLQTAMGDLVQSTVTNSSGGFLFSNIRSGNYQIVANVAGYHSAVWSLQVGFTPVIGLTFSMTRIETRSRLREGAEKGPNTVSVRELLIPKKARKEFQKAVESERRGKTDDAIKHWEKSIQIYPQFAESYMQLSRIYANSGKTDLATKDAERAVALDSKSAAAYDYLGYAYVKAGDVPRAQEAFQKAVRISNSDWFGHFWLGKLFFQQRDAKSAYPHLLRARQLRPRLPEICILFYNDLLVLGHKRQALAQLDYFLKHFPKNPMAETVRKTRKVLVKSMADGSR